MPAFAITFASPISLAIAATLAATVIALAFLRRIRMPFTARIFLLTGLIALVLAAGGFIWRQPTPRPVAVMVDLSGSTRTARYRDPAALKARISQLLGSTPHQITWFAAENRASAPQGDKLPDLPGDRTIFAPPPAAAVVLFSDARFALPAAAPPTYVVVDPLLEDPPDACVERLEMRGQAVAVTVTNRAADERQLDFSSPQSPRPRKIARGTFFLTHPVGNSTKMVAATFSGDDPWPENDRLALRVPPPQLSQRWWVGPNPPAGWRTLSANSLPLDGAEYLAPSTIVLNNISASDLSDDQHKRLAQYVRDLGGAIVILGGDHAFAAGAYTGTPLELLSPLASAPPDPTLHWILLADSSGSMAEGEPGATRWDLAKQAMLRILPHLPPEDPVTIGSFAQNLRWWSRGRQARETATLSLPPADVQPSGPTNLEPALFDIISRADAAYPKQLLILSDADADITQLAQLRIALVEKKISLYLLDTYGKGRGLDALRQLADASGGKIIQEIDPQKWVNAAHKLLEMAAPDRLIRTPAEVRFSGELSNLPGRAVPLWNRTWIKPTATALAITNTRDGPTSLAARWQVGAGQVFAGGFAPNSSELAAFEKLVAQPPHDPRFRITWEPGQQLRVVVDAVQNSAFLNREGLHLELSSDSGDSNPQSQVIPQTAPGRYELTLPAPRQPVFAAVRHNGQVLDRTAIAGRYAPEFDAVGNDHAAMQELAARTGGAVIPPTQSKPIEFNWPRRDVPLSSWLAAAAALLIALGLLRWRVL